LSPFTFISSEACGLADPAQIPQSGRIAKKARHGRATREQEWQSS
jgi:hypothetical protein